MKKIIFALGLGVGFFVGSRMGREPYEKLEQTARSFAEDPRVQEKVTQAKDAAARTAQDAAETARAKAPEVADQLKERAAAGADAVKGTADKAKDRASARADEAKDKVTSKADEVSGKAAQARTGDGTTAPDADTDGRDAATGGEATVGDKPLES